MLNIRIIKKVTKRFIIQGKLINMALPDRQLLAAIHYKEPVLVEKLIFSQLVKIHFIYMNIYIYIYIYFLLWRCDPTPVTASSFLRFLDQHNDAPQSVGLLWTSDQLVAETST